MAPKYRLTYFNGRGLGEVARYMFAIANVPYEDIRIEHEQWPELKKKQPFGKLPVLDVDGFQLSESRAIYRYLADQFGLLGKNKLEAARCEMIIGSLFDLLAFRGELFRESDEAKKEEILKKFVTVTVPENFPYFQKQLKNNGSKYFVGDSLTVADLIVAIAFSDLQLKVPTILDNYEDLKEHMNRIHDIPAIKQWIAKRPKTEF